MSVDMSPEAIGARLRACQPPDLRPERRLDHKLDMSAAGIGRRLEQVSRLRELGRFLLRAGASTRAAARAAAAEACGASEDRPDAEG